MSGARAAKNTDVEFEKGRVGQTKVHRYWPGRAPEWEETARADDDAAAAPKERTRTEIAAPVIVRKAVDDPRLRRLQQSRDQDHDKEEALELRRRIRESEEEQEEQEDEDDEKDQQPEEQEDEEELLRRRQAVRERLLQQRKQEEEKAQADEEEEEEGSSEYETDSEEEDEDDTGYGRRLLKPVFVPKEARETIAEREKLEQEEEELAMKEKLRLQERKVETQQLVRERVAQEEAERKGGDPEAQRLVEAVDTDDEADPVAAYESWKHRELRRIRRDREEKETAQREAEEREKLKNMTDLERAAWERANPKEQKEGEKKKMKFLQKYFHKGAYYQDAPDDTRATAGGYEIYKRDFSAPTGEDAIDKSSLPAVMQVKKFGRSGRTKWTHLVAEDTTAMDDPLADALKEEARKKQRAAGGAEEFQKPKKFKFGNI